MNNTSKALESKRLMANEGIQRVPRPMGLTLALSSIHTNPSSPAKQEQLQKIKDNQIESWILNQFTINDKLITIQTLSTYLNLPMQYILLKINRSMDRLGAMLKGDKKDEFTRVLFLQALFGTSESVALARHQAKVMLASQGDGYQAFISQATNGAIDNLTKANKAFQGLLEILKPNSSAITINPSGTQDGPKKHTITADEAINLIREESKSIIQDEAQLEAVYQGLQGPNGLPDVQARNQDLTGIGIGKKAKKASVRGPGGSNLGLSDAPIRPLRDGSPGLIDGAEYLIP